MNVTKNSAILIFWFYFDFVLCANTGNLAKVWSSITLLRKVEHFRNRNIAAKTVTWFHKKYAQRKKEKFQTLTSNLVEMSLKENHITMKMKLS